MASHPDSLSMALFCDFENVALGVRDAQYEKFDIKPVLERLLLKGSIVVKKAYCDWDRYKAFKATMHEANFELIEIPHVRQSGKNSADIRLVVDALDLCYTKSHVDTFVIISGDSDFSPLVSKLRENAKQVIGVGIKQSTSDLLIANCDEFIFYDDLVRESQRATAKREPRTGQAAARRTPEEEKHRKDDLETRRSKAIDLAVATFDALVSERGDSGKMWASVLKEAIKRRRPDFNESYYGFRAFGNLLEAAQQRGLIEVGRDEKSGTYVYRALANEDSDMAYQPVNSTADNADEKDVRPDDRSTAAQGSDTRRRGRGGRGNREGSRQAAASETPMAEHVPTAYDEADASSAQAHPTSDDAAEVPASRQAAAQAKPESVQVGSNSAPVVQDTAAESIESAGKRSRRGRHDRSTRADVSSVAQATTQSDVALPAVVSAPQETATPLRASPRPADPKHNSIHDLFADSPVQQASKEAGKEAAEAAAMKAEPKTQPKTARAKKVQPAASETESAAASPAPDGKKNAADPSDAPAPAAKKAARKRAGTKAVKKSSDAAPKKDRDADGE